MSHHYSNQQQINHSDSSYKSSDRCIHILKHEKEELGRALLEKQAEFIKLLHTMLKKEVLTKTQLQSIMRSKQTADGKCLLLLSAVEDRLQTATIAGDSCTHLVDNLVTSLLDHNLHSVATRLQPQLTREYLLNPASVYYSEDTNPYVLFSTSFDNNTGVISYSDSYPSTNNNDNNTSSSCSGTTNTITNDLTSTIGCIPSPRIHGSQSTPSLSTSTAAKGAVASSGWHGGVGLHESASEGSGLYSANATTDSNFNVRVMINNIVRGPGPGAKSDEMYRNCSRPRGLVFIANYSFKDNLLHKHREGSEVDVRNLEQLFTQMGYCIPKVHHDLTTADTMRELRHFRDDRRHAECDACVVIIMSHGKGENSFYTSQGPSINDEQLLELFSNSGCPALDGKPKIFIFQYCRGDQRDCGVSSSSLQLVSQGHGMAGTEQQTDSAKMGRTQHLLKRPTYSDMFIVYSTIKGYVSFRDPQQGSWLITSMCKVLMNNACSEDLSKLFKMVSRKIIANESQAGSKQTCETHSRAFDKDFFFNPYDRDQPYVAKYEQRGKLQDQSEHKDSCSAGSGGRSLTGSMHEVGQLEKSQLNMEEQEQLKKNDSLNKDVDYIGSTDDDYYSSCNTFYLSVDELNRRNQYDCELPELPNNYLRNKDSVVDKRCDGRYPPVFHDDGGSRAGIHETTTTITANKDGSRSSVLAATTKRDMLTSSGNSGDDSSTGSVASSGGDGGGSGSRNACSSGGSSISSLPGCVVVRDCEVSQLSLELSIGSSSSLLLEGIEGLLSDA